MKYFRETKKGMYVKKTVLLMILGIFCIGLLGCGKENNAIPSIEVTTSTENDITAEKLGIEEEEEKAEVPAEEEEPETVSENEIDYHSVSPESVYEESVSDNAIEDEHKIKMTEDGKVIVDLVMFMGQSNMSGSGGNAAYAPVCPEGHGYEFRTMSDPTRLYPIVEPFGINENNINGIMDFPGAKKGSMVSAFANKYYEETGVPIVAVSASQGGTGTDFWMKQSTIDDFTERQKRAQVWLESNDYHIRKQYVIWLQGESDAFQEITTESYMQNMDNIIRPLFIGGVQKVFIITTGRMIMSTDYYDKIISAQIELCKKSGYYALATTVLSAVSTEYMVDEVHYNQSVLNLLGEEAALSASYYTNNTKEKCLYDYKNHTTYIPEGFGYEDNVQVEPVDVNNDCGLTRY